MSIIEVGAAELESALAGGARLIDVRESSEYEAGHVAGAVHVPLGTVAEQLDAFRGDGAAYVICQVGGRSMRACEYLAGHGIEAVNVAGGTKAWAASGRPLHVAGRPQ